MSECHSESGRIGLYVHVPFCISKCRYCGFYSESLEQKESEGRSQETGEKLWRVTGDELRVKTGGKEGARGERQETREEASRVSKVIDAMVGEMEGYDLSGVDTVYVGGGSPSAIPEGELVRLLEYIHERCALAAQKGVRPRESGSPKAHRFPQEKGSDPILEVEFTVEVNPGQVTFEKLRKMRELGVNRLSMGAQSFDDGELAFLGRRHKVADVIRSVAAARKAGFANISIDLIFAIPGSSMASWEKSLRIATALGVEHISAYALTYEEGTPLYAASERGEVAAVDEELDRAMYEAAIDLLGAAGYGQYEISNFAKAGFECRHNLKYWANDEYVGIGPAAASWYRGTRWSNVASIEGYVKGISEIHHEGHEEHEDINRCMKAGSDEYADAGSVSAGRIDREVSSEGHEEGEGRRGNPIRRVRVEEHRPDAKEVACETAVLNLRRLRGIELEEYRKRTGFDATELFGETIRRYEMAGMLKVDGGRVFLTREALPVADSVLCDFASAE